jgi:hypothetical protein
MNVFYDGDEVIFGGASASSAYSDMQASNLRTSTGITPWPVVLLFVADHSTLDAALAGLLEDKG